MAIQPKTISLQPTHRLNPPPKPATPGSIFAAIELFRRLSRSHLTASSLPV
jgi:hypothetical protein